MANVTLLSLPNTQNSFNQLCQKKQYFSINHLWFYTMFINNNKPQFPNYLDSKSTLKIPVLFNLKNPLIKSFEKFLIKIYTIWLN